MLGGIILLLVFVLAITAPKAEIELVLKEKFFKRQYEVNVNSSISSVLLNLNLIPVYESLSIKQSEREQFIYIDATKRVIKKKDLESFLLAKIQSEISEDENVNEDALVYKATIADPVKEKLFVYVEARLVPSVDLVQLKRGIAGKPKNQANEILRNTPNIETFSVHTTPSWLPLMPLLKDRIIILVNSKLRAPNYK